MIGWIQDAGVVLGSHGAREDYNAGSLNSLNGANLVKSHESEPSIVL